MSDGNPRQGRAGPAKPAGDKPKSPRPGRGSDASTVRQQLEASERERALLVARERTLRLETQHRVGNVLAIVRSVFSRTVESAGSIEDLESHFRGRLDALARHQVALSIDPNRTCDLENMIREELRSFEFDDRIEIAGPDVDVPGDVVPTLGLAIHELVTNALKFGALCTSQAATRLKVSWTHADGWLLLKWLEEGPPLTTPAPVTRGFGREFIEAGLPYQLGATTTFQLRSDGLSCSIAIQLDDAVSTAAKTRDWS